MAAVCGASSTLTLCLCVLLLPAASGFQAEDRECAFTDHLQGAEPHSGPANVLRGVVQENGTVRCSHGSRCYGLWEKRSDGEIHLVKQGCWSHIGNQQECRGDRCLVTATPSHIQNGSYRFCCCNQDLCNTNFTEALPIADTPALRVIKTDGRGHRQTDQQPLRREETALIALVTVAIAAIGIVVWYLAYRILRGKQKHSLSALDVMEAANSDSAVDLDNLKLLELIGRGRYGTVFRGCLDDRCVAVKLFSAANRQNYANERAIYRLPLLQHDNIARFLTADEKTTADGRPEFLILMDFYPHGCLSRYLSLHTVDWATCCRMTHGVTRGLAFLHTELCRGDQYKPPVAHRDLTSRNILVRADLSCVLADFGLSMRLTGSWPRDDDTVAISEAGTVRYMAPEVLGGALNLRDCEAALKQVDVYALGLLYWESFRRCSHLFPGEAVPEYQLAFQAELGNHPSFKEMQILVVKEKYRPRFPEGWKGNSLVLRSLKETMEDCWDQDAEARLTAQCAEERLSELTLLSTHTAVYDHGNLSHGFWPPQVGSASSYIEERQVDMVKNLQRDSNSGSVTKMTTGGAEGAEKNRNSINYERQQAQSQCQPRRFSSDSSVSTTTALTPASILCSRPEPEHSGGAVPSVPFCLQLTKEDLAATKLNPTEVDKNLKESSDESLIEHSQKQFGSTEQQTNNLLYYQILQTAETNGSVLTAQGEQEGVGGVDTNPSSSIHPLPKQQNAPRRPTSLHLLPKTKETSSASSRLKLGKLKSNHRQVETGVAKMNTVTVATVVAPHMVTTVTKDTSTGGRMATGNRVPPTIMVANGYSAGVPTLVTNGMIGGGRTNPAGPQLEEEEDKMEGWGVVGGDKPINLLNFSPDEHEPLLRREQLPTESKPLPCLHHHHQSKDENILSGQSSNSNNNNNRIALGSDIESQGLDVESERVIGPEVAQYRGINCTEAEPHLESQQSSECPATVPVLNLENTVLGSAGLVTSGHSPTPQTPLTGHNRGQGSDTGSCVQKALFGKPVLATGSPRSPEAHLVHSTTRVLVPGCRDPVSGSVLALENPAPETLALRIQDSEITDLAVPKAAALQSPILGSQTLNLLHHQMDSGKAKRPERPCSLDLSSSCISSDDVDQTDNSSLSASGEKIKRRVKTPYNLKKWRPASWVVSTDTALNLDFMFNTHFSSGLQRAGSISIPKVNQSKSSMSVLLASGGAITTTTEPDGMTSF